jgi:hypothetical protein
VVLEVWVAARVEAVVLEARAAVPGDKTLVV